MLHKATVFLLAAAIIPVATAHAQTMRTVSVTMVRTGWAADSFAIVTAEPVANPAGCPTPDGYISEKADPGYQTLYAAALTAIATRLPTVVTVDNSHCGYAGRPKLIGVNLQSAP